MNLTFDTDGREDAFKVRERVFVVEQGFKHEFDDIDERENTVHIAAYENGALVGCSRIFPDDESEDGFVFGRMAVLPEYRGRGIGSEILLFSEEACRQKGARSIRLHAQCRACGFYETLGYRSYGPIELDEHVEHVWMTKRL